ncbi:MAG TPA: diphosphate--fructose-6-phosphate 1-phosphotransferase [Myxococcota bacterium]|nr:diphosphate--fructose-6-phosphate 1-phosphotransferase [Myxococcota bacterium]HNZ04059.1 diphosphate--fructose-6-phosphate 1-phosphotransferase [Myxococcota bacterium]HOD06545.1 diphosphate--fructose-6-phosphate 1-phosphotransferase [Myxococcota bacterium]HPB50534.1 diphosphate--fructose-6-phosphate 1-phosphotransferase [Myxococcota bacterium]HQP95637.1 diphosphate--fructose-6-phosphate 1-phosphotransferase [Myxococcota bacterium]
MRPGNLVIGQSGGPTAVINASLVGVIREAKKHDVVRNVYGMRWGIQGFMEEAMIDLGKEPDDRLELLSRTPSSALGSCRLKLKDEHLPRVLEVIRKHDIRFFFYIGGDDSQNTTHRVVEYCRAQGYEIYGIGIPKTVDNDLFGTDHTPGYGSAARYVALSAQQGGILARDMQKVDPVCVYQAVGRDAGWLAAAAALAKRYEDDPPHLIYIPERPFTKERLFADVERCYSRYGFVSIVVGEGIAFPDGTPVSGTQTFDKFGNPEFGAMGGASAAMVVKNLACDHLGCRGEFQIVESLQMAGMDRASEVDRHEALMAGVEGVRLAVSGKSGLMVSFERAPGDVYECRYVAVPLLKVNEGKQTMPDRFIDDENSFVTPAFLDYLRPLVGELPEMGRLSYTGI